MILSRISIYRVASTVASEADTSKVSIAPIVILMCSEMHVFPQVCLFRKVEGGKRSEANPRSSKQLKSLSETDNCGFLYCSKVLCFLKTYEN